MNRKPRTRTSVWKHLGFAALVLLIIALVLWGALWDVWFCPVTVVFSVFAALVLAFWALLEHLGYSFGKSRYPTRTERQRMRHQRNKDKGGEKVLGRDITDRRDV